MFCVKFMVLWYILPLFMEAMASRNSSQAEVPFANTSTSWACTRVRMSAHCEVDLLWRSLISLPGSNSAYSSKLVIREIYEICLAAFQHMKCNNSNI